MRRVARTRPAGFILAVLFIIALILFVTLFALYQWMVDENVRAHRYQAGEVVSNLALSAAEGAFQFVATELNRPGSPLRRRLIRPDGPETAALSPTPAGGVILTGADLPDTVAVPEVLRLARDLGLDSSAIELRITFFGFRALEAGPLAGIAIDPAEVEGLVRVRAEVTQGRVRRAFLGQKEARISNHLAPFFSKFSLVIAAQPPEDVSGAAGLNRMALDLPLDRARRELTWDLNGGGRVRASPLTVVNHPGVPGWRDAGGPRQAIAPLFAARPELVDRAGLIYLGAEGSPSEWMFNVASDGFYDRPDVQGTESFGLRLYPYARSIPGPGTVLEEVSGFYEGVLDEAAFLGRPRFILESPGGSPLTDRVPWLRLFGDQRAVSPTLVLGPASRRYLRYAYQDAPSGTSYLGYFPDEATWRAESPLVNAFGGDWSRYASEMARLVVEPYNRGADWILTNRERQTGTASVGYMLLASGTEPGDPLDPPLALAARMRTDAAAVPGYPASALEAINSGSGYRLTRVGLARGSRSLFSGDALALLADPGRDAFWSAYLARLDRKAVRWVRNQEVLGRLYTRTGAAGAALMLPGVVKVNEGGLTIGPARVRRGGMILVPGDVSLRGPITCEPGEVLTIVSRQGSVTIANDRTIEAAVVALAGRLAAPSGLDLRGAVAVRSVAVTATIAGAQPRVITYDPELDPTDPATDTTGEDAYLKRTRYIHEEGTVWAID